MPLPPGGVLTGQVVDEFGEPIPEVMVSVQRYQFAQGRRMLAPAGRTTNTNDASRYQNIRRPRSGWPLNISGLPAGDYYVVAIDRIESGHTGDPESLENLRRDAKRFSLAEARRRPLI